MPGLASLYCGSYQTLAESRHDQPSCRKECKKEHIKLAHLFVGAFNSRFFGMPASHVLPFYSSVSPFIWSCACTGGSCWQLWCVSFFCSFFVSQHLNLNWLDADSDFSNQIHRYRNSIACCFIEQYFMNRRKILRFRRLSVHAVATTFCPSMDWNL